MPVLGLFVWLGAQYNNLAVLQIAQVEQIRTAVEEYADLNVFTLDYPREGEPTVHIGADDLTR